MATTRTAPPTPFANARHHAGCVWWTDLSTPDVDGAKQFYGQLLDWTFEDQQMTDGGFYSMAQRAGFDAAAITGQREDQRGMPAYWTTYVTVEDVDSAAATASELGAAVIAEPFDVMDVGRMTMIQDPVGAMVALWEAKTHPGAEIVSQPGAYTWSELMVNGDTAPAERFWTQLMGWTADRQSMGDMGEYVTFMHDGHPACGMIRIPEMEGQTPPSAWMSYFAVADVEQAISRITQLGGTVHMGPLPAPGIGTWAMANDPQGGHFYVIQLDEWPVD